jgi:hypothetical protein
MHYPEHGWSQIVYRQPGVHTRPTRCIPCMAPRRSIIIFLIVLRISLRQLHQNQLISHLKSSLTKFLGQSGYERVDLLFKKI